MKDSAHRTSSDKTKKDTHGEKNALSRSLSVSAKDAFHQIQIKDVRTENADVTSTYNIYVFLMMFNVKR